MGSHSLLQRIFPIQGSDPAIKPMSPASPELEGRFFTTEPPGKPILVHTLHVNQITNICGSFHFLKMFQNSNSITVKASESESVSHSVVSDSLQPMDCSPPGSSVHGILQARILEWVATSIFRESSQPRSNPGLLHCKQMLYSKLLGKPQNTM